VIRPTILTSAGFAFLLLLVAAGLIGFYSFVYYRETRQVRRLTLGQTLILWGLRGLAAALAVLALMRPAWIKTRSETRPPTVAVLFDGSQSMNYDEAYENALTGGVRSSRYKTAKDALDIMVQPLAKEHDVRLFKFSYDLKDIGTIPAKKKNVPNSAELFKQADGREDAADGDYTKIAEAGLSTLTRLSGEEVSGVILFSDGRQTNGKPLAELVKKVTGGANVPISTIVFGSDSPARDLSIDEVDCPTEASLGDVLVFSVTITNHIQSMLEVPLSLSEASAEDYAAAADEQALNKAFTQSVTPRKLRLTSGRNTVSIACIPETEGKRVFRLTLPKMPDEVNDANNSFTVGVTVAKRELRVLLIASEPNREYLYMVPALLRDPVINLSCYLQSADIDYIHQGNTNIEKPPQTEKEWRDFDVAVLMDVDPNKLSVQQIAGLEEMVGKGGGLLVIGGRNQGLAKFIQVHPAKVRQMLPVEIDKNVHPDHDKLFDRSFAVVRTSAGRDHPVLRISGDDRVNEEIWKTFPRFFWAHPVKEAKPRVPVLLQAEDGLPLVAAHRYREGAVMYCGLDSLWLWRYPYESFDYDRFWTRAIRYLGESKLKGAQQQVALSSNQHIYAPGETVELSLRILDPSLAGQLNRQPIRVSVVSPNKVSDPVTLRAVADNLYKGKYRALRVGSLTAQVEQKGTDSEHKVLFKAEHHFEVKHQSLEAKDPTADLEAMKKLAEDTKGEYVDCRNMTPERLREVAANLPKKPKVSEWQEKRDIWDGAAFLFVFLALVSSEWSLRKWWGLL
jgi:uncharacterized membrane protein